MARVSVAEPAGTREKLLEAAIRLLASNGPEGLQARKVAAEIGASTMAVYTHFGGMPQLTEAIVREGFRRLDRQLSTVEQSRDPMADLFALGLAYRAHALDNPQLYRLMFGLSTPLPRRGTRRNLLAAEGIPTDLAEGQTAFGHLVTALTRVIDSGRIRTDDPTRAAAQVWSAIHGYVLLEIAGFFGRSGRGVEHVLRPLGIHLAVGMGDTVRAATRSARAAQRSAAS
jgi:AcrR family transcriptional regulator